MQGNDDSEAVRRASAETALHRWRTDGEWPTVRQVHRHIVRELHVSARLYDVVEFFRHRTGASGPDSKAGLLLRDVFILDPSAPELAVFVRTVRLCVRRYFESDDRWLTSDEVGKELGIDRKESRKLYDMIHDVIMSIPPH